FQLDDQDNLSLPDTDAPDDSSSHTLEFSVGADQPAPDDASESPPTAESPDNAGFFDLASRLDTTDQMASPSAPQSPPSSHLKVEAPENLATSEISDIVKEFKQGIMEEVGEEDYETHYELGISYKEMSLFDDAIEELKLAALDPARFVECQGVIALCYLEQGDYNQGIQAFQEARARVDPQGEKYQDLTYQIATTYDQAGQQEQAVELYQELFQLNSNYRDVKRRLKKLLG
ncbi:tetratricopeptide repeat protein, partial [candidate division KSB3 bacterium]|nr:tetratricopeptide repeat protein [candidate division KSB3 bacterium]MBD3326838.1 tetratricopeptide repeat protein [candidate division KSB3 bacterium]